jgi:hypothetical protein
MGFNQQTGRPQFLCIGPLSINPPSTSKLHEVGSELLGTDHEKCCMTLACLVRRVIACRRSVFYLVAFVI